MIADMVSNKKPYPVVTELFIRGRKINISVFVTQSSFAVPKNVRLNSTHYFVMKIPNKRELQKIAFNHSSDIDFKDFMNLYKKSTAKPHSGWLAHLVSRFACNTRVIVDASSNPPVSCLKLL